MTAKRKKHLSIVVASVLAALFLFVGLSFWVVRTEWFSNVVRAKLVATLESSTGGRVEIGSFRFEPSRLIIRVRGLTIHGTEPGKVSPLVAISELELRLKLFSGLYHAVDLAALTVEEPRINFIVNPDGSTNIPSPKPPHARSTNSPLATIVDLAVGQFRVDHGSFVCSQHTTPFELQGENLQISLDYNSLLRHYSGRVDVSPLRLSSRSGQPLDLRIKLPLTLSADSIQLNNAHLSTEHSQVDFDASLRDLSAPNISAKGHSKLSTAEMQRFLNLPADPNLKGTPQSATSDFAVRFDQSANTLAVQHLNVVLGKSTFHASGVANSPTGETVRFGGSLAVAELLSLTGVRAPKITGDLGIEGHLALGPALTYSANGTIESGRLSFQHGTTHLSNVSLRSPFYINPTQIDLNSLNIAALGGTLTAKVIIQQMQQLTAEGELRNVSLTNIASAFSRYPVGYGGVVSASLSARTNIAKPAFSDAFIGAHVSISPTKQGVPVKGRLDAALIGTSGNISISDSFITLPHSQIHLSGSLNKDLSVSLKSLNLNDLLPIANLGGSSEALPIVLRGGRANLDTHVRGSLSSPSINAHVGISGFSLNNDLFDRLSLDLSASPSEASLQNGLLSRNSLRSTFDGSIALTNWRPLAHSALSANVSIKNADLGDLLALNGSSDFRASGATDAEVHINGTYGDPLGAASARIAHANLAGQPFDGIETKLTLSHGLISLDALDLHTAGGHVNATALFRHPATSMTSGHIETHLRCSGLQLSEVAPLQQKSPGSAGTINFTSDVSTDLNDQQKTIQVKISNVYARLSAANLRVRNQDAGRLTAVADTVGRNVKFDVNSNFAGSSISIGGITALSPDYQTEATAAIKKLPLSKTLEISGQGNLPIAGSVDADIAFTGTPWKPDVRATLNLSNANIYQEPVNHLVTTLHYTTSLAELSAFNLRAPAGEINLRGRYENPTNANQPSLVLQVSSNLELGKVQHAQLAVPGVRGNLSLIVDLAGTIKNEHGAPHLLLSHLNSDVSAKGINLNRRNLGGLTFTTRTTESKVVFKLDTDLAEGQIKASGESQLLDGYPTRGNLTFNNIRYSNIEPLLVLHQGTRQSFDALLQGKASFDGVLPDVNSFKSRMELDRLELSSSSRATLTGSNAPKTVLLKNDGPLILSLARSTVDVDQFRIRGPKTSINLAGTVGFSSAANKLNLKVSADSDLGLLRDLDPDFFSSGNVALNALVSGSLVQPLVNGQIELHGANINYAHLPNGLSNGNAVILLNGKTAAIQSLTGESGGGKIKVTGFAGLSPRAIVFDLNAKASNVRTRYASVSVVSNADVALTGNSVRSLLSGKVVVQRVSYSSSSDFGSLLDTASGPPAVVSNPSPLLAGMRLDIAVSTASDVRIITPYVGKLSLISALQIRGTAAEPGIVGQINVTDGQLAFFGNTYNVNRGSINFYDPSAIRPELALSLETVVRGVDVSLDVTGPISNMKLSYRSDPPLSFQQIVQLLATNTTPFDPTIAAHQPPAPQQSMSQTGESAILDQAIANPLASRVQRVFGLSQFKIDPSVAGSNGQPTAKVTLQQKIANNLTFTYITDVTQSNSEIVRVEWDLGAKTSAVALRDYNGNVSIELFRKFQVR